MEHRDRERIDAAWGQKEADDLDLELDAALAKYAVVEPRAGLEERVLANLRAERERVPVPSWWRRSAVLAAVVLIAVALAWRWARPTRPVLTKQPSVSAPAQHPATQFTVSATNSRVRPSTPGNARKSATHKNRAQIDVAAQPRLDQFPSPEPLSEQERILQSYVTKYPEHAVLLARARTEALRRDQLEEMTAISPGWATGSEKRNQEPNNDSTE